MAYVLGAGFVPIRKQGKLPARTYAQSYDLEYGAATLEVHTDAFDPGDRVLIVDDVLATRRHGGRQTAELIRRESGATVAGIARACWSSDSSAGRAKLPGLDVRSLPCLGVTQRTEPGTSRIVHR